MCRLFYIFLFLGGNMVYNSERKSGFLMLGVFVAVCMLSMISVCFADKSPENKLECPKGREIVYLSEFENKPDANIEEKECIHIEPISADERNAIVEHENQMYDCWRNCNDNPDVLSAWKAKYDCIVKRYHKKDKCVKEEKNIERQFKKCRENCERIIVNVRESLPLSCQEYYSLDTCSCSGKEHLALIRKNRAECLRDRLENFQVKE